MNKKKTLLNVLLILFVLSFFVTPLGHYGKVFLNRAFSFSPKIIEVSKQKQLPDYNWRLKDEKWNFFNFEKSQGKVVFINFWASWRLPSEAELSSIQKLYDTYSDKVDFYIITNEDRPPVEEFMAKHEFSFPVTYLIIGDRAPLHVPKPPFSYVIDKKGNIVVEQEGIADWDTEKVHALFEELIAQ